MKSVLVIGLGRFGTNAIKTLNSLGHEIMAIDRKEENVDAVMPLVTNALIGDSTNRVFLESLGIPNFDLCIVTIGESFQDSLETTSLLKELGAQTVVARASSDIHEKFLLRNGADQVVYPEKKIADWTAIRFSSDHVLDYIPMNEDYSIFEVTVPEHWAGQSVQQLQVRRKFKINILAIREHDHLSINIDPEVTLNNQMTLLVLGKTRDLKSCFAL